MAWFQAPTDSLPHPEPHLHPQFYPPYRTSDRLKYLAGTELAAGMFTNDTLPEEKAKELQAVSVNLKMSVSA
jgi:UDPglucose--hexose-1-phosphate uridylyltransferase